MALLPPLDVPGLQTWSSRFGCFPAPAGNTVYLARTVKSGLCWQLSSSVSPCVTLGARVVLGAWEPLHLRVGLSSLSVLDSVTFLCAGCL